MNSTYVMNRAMLAEKIDDTTIAKLKNNPDVFLDFINTHNESTTVYVLEKLGRLNNDSVIKPLIILTHQPNDKIRYLSIKNLAKLKDRSLMKLFIEYASKDESTDVRREAVSAIGRLKHEDTVEALVRFLGDEDPKVVLQAIRGLMIFLHRVEVKKEFKKLLNHPNENIQAVISKEINKGDSNIKKPQKQDQSLVFLKNTVVHGDVQDVLKCIPDESIHLTFTSPPYYNARDYSIYQSYNEYLSFLEVVFQEVHRITKEGRFFILNTSPIIVPRFSRSHSSRRYPIPYDIHPLLVKMGWEFIDDIVWVKPEASAKNRNAGFLQHRKPLGYKPNAISEMLMVYRKKTDKLIDWNMRQYDKEITDRSKVPDGYETTNVWHIDPSFDKVHSAVFPIDLCNRIIKYYSFVDDIVFDPFAGSGTLGRSAINLERNFFLVEKETKYIHRMKEHLTKNGHLFHASKTPVKVFNINDFMDTIKAKK